MCLKHLTNIKTLNHSVHQRQAFRNCHNDDRNTKNQTTEEQICNITNSVIGHIHKAQHNLDNCCCCTTTITKLANTISKPIQFFLRRSFTLIFLLKRNIDSSENSIITNTGHLHNCRTRSNNTASKALELRKEVIIARNFIVTQNNFLCLSTFTIQCRLIHIQRTIKQNTICRNLVTRLKIYTIFKHNVINRQLNKITITINLYHDLTCFILKCLCTSVLLIVDISANKRHCNNNQKNCHSTEPIIRTQIRPNTTNRIEYDFQGKSHHQNSQPSILQGLFKHVPERFCLSLGKFISSFEFVDFCLPSCKTKCFQCSFLLMISSFEQIWFLHFFLLVFH